MKTLSKIALAVFLLATPFLIYGFGSEVVRLFGKFDPFGPRWLPFLIGAASFFPFVWVARRVIPSTWSWLETFEHEMAHLLIGLLFLKIPVGIRVSAHEGGEVRQIGRGTTGQTWVTLAPYFFPTVSIAVAVVGYIADLGSPVLLGLLGWTTSFHLVTNWAETSFRQPDLKKVGFLKTILILPVMNLICYGAVLAFVAGSFGGFFPAALRTSVSLVRRLTGM